MTILTAPETVGMDPKKLDELEQLFRGQIERGLHPGAGLAVYRYGKPVLDIDGGVADSSIFNEPQVHTAIVPGAGGMATAGDLARFYAMMERRGTPDGTAVLSQAAVDEAVTLQIEGTDASSNMFAQRSLRLALADERMGVSTGKPLNTFGHGGAGTSIGWADFDSGLAMGYITNGFRGNETNVPCLAAVSQAVRNACS